MPANCPPESMSFVMVGITWLLFMLVTGAIAYWSGHSLGQKTGRLEGFEAGYNAAKRKYKGR